MSNKFECEFDVLEEISHILGDKRQELANLQDREIEIEVEIEALEIVFRMLEEAERVGEI